MSEIMKCERCKEYNAAAVDFRHQATSAQNDYAALLARHNALVEAVHIYNSGYHAGHHDTVEGGYVDIHPSDMDSYHAEEVSELLAALVGEEGK